MDSIETNTKRIFPLGANPKKIIPSLLVMFFLSITTVLAQGPNAPEAAGFEPVDATDMVNLLTGDLTYVIPLLNVPSPEGGYPLALSYHSGIGMDQEASWVGLGWNLNPGAINRGVNGYPDDWKNGVLSEKFYDVGGSSTTHTLSASYTSLTTGFSLSNSLSYSSNRGFGGSVGIGFGYDLGEGSKLGVQANAGIAPGGYFSAAVGGGFQSASGFSIDGNIGTRGYGIGVGFNGGQDADYKGGSVGISRSYEGETSISLAYGKGSVVKRNGVGLNFSSDGISLRTTFSGVGIGSNYALANTISANDYNVDVDRTFFTFAFPVGDPGGLGIFSIGYSRQKVKWFLNTNKTSSVSGALYLGDAIKYACEVRTRTTIPGVSTTTSTAIRYVDSQIECDCANISYPNMNGISSVCEEANLVSLSPVNGGEYFMDVYEIGTNGGKTELKDNNAVFPAYDDYRVTAQGVSGSLIPLLSRTGALMGLPRKIEDIQDYEVKYNISANSGYNRGQYYGSKPNTGFSFKNEYSSSLIIEPGGFANMTDPAEIYGYYNGGGTSAVDRKQDGRVVQHYTLKEMYDGNAGLLPKDFLSENQLDADFASLSYIDFGNMIGGYEVTTPDGKTYHYKQPVFNRMTKTRTIGAVNGKPERESYFESTQAPYVTHWLLTAITGPDYAMTYNANRDYPDEGDLGYWVRFDYGKWSGTDVWKAPYGKEYNVSQDNPDIKYNTHGIKELYYLDRIKTRTHTAIFVKNLRNDDYADQWEYKSFSGGVPNSNDFDQSSFIYPSQVPLRLEKIILVKNGDDQIDKSSGTGLSVEDYIGGPIVPYGNNNHNLHTKVVDITDNIGPTLAKAIKIIDFGKHYSYDLVDGALNATSGRLTLNGLTFLGKGGTRSLPPYKFEYDNSQVFDFENKMDRWGYHKDNPAVWSLNKITMPTGGFIGIQYEPDDYGLVAVDPLLNGAKGGGLRVKSVSVNDQSNTYYTAYSYNKPGTHEDPLNANYVSSGVISYIPLEENEEPTIGYGSELPAPIPLYEYVTVKNGMSIHTNEYLTRNVYRFKVMDPKDPSSIKFGDLLEITVNQDFTTYNNPNAKNVEAKNISIIDNMATLGQVLEFSQYNNEGQLLSKTVNTYASTNEISKGIIQEGFEVFKEVDYDNTSNDDWLISTSKRIHYPSVLKQTEISTKGYSFKTEFVKHDDITGMLLETISEDSKGNTIKTVTTPAYHIPEYIQMGPKINSFGWSINENNKNMLSQITMHKSYLDLGGSWEELSVGISTWKNFGSGIWRKHRAYLWDGELNANGTFKDYNETTDDAFVWDWDSAQTNTKWLKVSEVTKYDNFSLPNEIMDINGNYLSTITCDDETKILGTSNSRFLDWKASGAEYLSSNAAGDYFEGGVLTNAQQVTTISHTGKYSVLVNAGQEGFKTIFFTGTPSLPINTSGKYKVSVWVNVPDVANARINTGNGNEVFNGESIRAGAWIQLNHYFDYSGLQDLTITATAQNGSVYMDDFRVGPISSKIVTYIYNDQDELSYKLNGNNLGVKYEYDPTGRLVNTYSEVIDFNGDGTGGFKQIGKMEYNFKK